MFCSSGSSSDSSAKTNQRAFKVYLAVEVTNDSQIIHGTVFVTIGESWDAGWNSCRRGGWSV